MLIIDARTLAIKSSNKLKFDATAMEICGSQIWVGDKKGNLHVFDASMTEIKSIEGKHSKAVTVLASNGKVVGSGDAYRYMLVWDGETHEELFSVGDHKDKIMDIFFTDSHMLSVTHDNAYGVSSLEERKLLRQQKMPHAEKLVFNAIWSNGSIVTLGGDCALRTWSL